MAARRNGVDPVPWLAAHVARQPEGNRDNALFWAACRAAESNVHDFQPLIAAAISAGLPERMLLSVAEVAAELGCGRGTVYALLTSGALPSVRLCGRLRRIRGADLTTYVESLAASRPSRCTPTVTSGPIEHIGTGRPGIEYAHRPAGPEQSPVRH